MWTILALLLACAGDPPVDEQRLRAVQAALRFPGEAGALDPRWSPPAAESAGERRYTVQVGGYAVRPGFRAAALLFLPDRPWRDAVLVAHGHYGEGKNSAEAQDIAHRLAAGGVAALVVDTPGVEEWELPGRAIHMEAGAHNRALLAAAGTSALALQVELLRRGLDLLQSLGAERIAATGASGGAVQSFWLALADPRVAGVALASVPPIPREARPGGCPCDQLPGFPGPDPSVLALLDVPSLWLSELEQPRPEGLRSRARFEVLPGPHSYNPDMITRALAWMRDALGFSLSDMPISPTPHVELHTRGPAEDPDWRAISGLALGPGPTWNATVEQGPAALESCQGEGLSILVAGGGDDDVAAIRGAGLRACVLSLLDDDGDGQAAALASGDAWADHLAGTLREAAHHRQAFAVYAVRAWAAPAYASALPYVVRDPVTRLDQLDPLRDPPWIHVPGAWWGGLERARAGAMAAGEDPVALVAALHAKILR